MLQPEFIVEPYLSGVRIDSFLVKHLRNFTTWRISRMVAAGLATVNGLPADTTQRVFRGQHVRIRLAEPPDKLLDSDEGGVPIVYEDPWLMVVDKPAGMVAHPVGRFQSGTLTNVLQPHLDQQTASVSLLRAGIVHRLDRMTSGLMAVTKEHHAHRIISEDFQAGRLQKTYIALVEGRVSFKERLIELPIGNRPDGRGVLMSAKADALRPRHAKTGVTVLQRRQHVSVIACRLYTGRNHQIRVHLAELGHPVLGDELYGPHGTVRSEPQTNSPIPTEKRHALHAAKLQFRHPILKTALCFASSVPPDFYGQCGASTTMRNARLAQSCS